MLRTNGFILIFILFTSMVSLFYLFNFNLYTFESEKNNSPNTFVVKGSQSSIISITEETLQEERVKACFVILIRNKELREWRKTMRQLEDRFNKNYNYPYVFLNDEPFTDEFKAFTRALTKADVEFGLIPKEHWSYPSHIDQNKAKETRESMKQSVIYGGSESYRHMCRFESGFFFRHNLTMKYDYYWRVEPGVSFSCEIDFDPFLYMKKNNKKYSFTISLYEYQATIETLWKTVKDWISSRNLKDALPKDNALGFVSDDNGESYNLCHFWSNFEIASFDLWRDPQYLDYFDYLDRSGGFFYERWGDAPVHSIYAALTLPKDQIHFFNQIGYTHPPYTHCPIETEANMKCTCDPSENFDLESYSCTNKWFQLTKK